MSDSTTTIRYSDAELQEFKALIEKKIERTKEELNYLNDQIEDLNASSADAQSGDWFDDSSRHADIEMLSNMATRQRQFLESLEAAMIRIKNKTYGICSVTGKLIDKKRLMVVPHATKSLEAKEIEKSGVKKPKVVIPPKAKSKESGEKKIITKVIKKPSGPPVPKKVEDDDDDEDFDLLDDDTKYDDFEDDDADIDDVDLENIPDEGADDFDE
jgi:RNA polymerase-binding transcription factor DksA